MKTVLCIALLVSCIVTSICGQTELLNIRWDPNSEADISRYRLERTVNSTANFQLFEETDHPNNHIVDRTVEPGNLYAYRIAAINTAGQNSPYSAVVSVGIPKIDLALQDIAAGSETALAKTAFLSDPDGDANNLQIQVSDENNVSVSVESDEIRISPVPLDYAGPAEFTIRTEDANGFFDLKTIRFNFVSANVNTPPHLLFTDVIEIEKDSSLTLSLVNFVVDSTNAINELTWEFSANAGINAQFNPSDYTLTLVPAPGFESETSITITVRDPLGLSDQLIVTVRVVKFTDGDIFPEEVNAGPQLVVYPNPIKTSRGHNEMIFLNLPQTTQSISLFALSGKNVYKEQMAFSTPLEYRININDNAGRFPSGLYVYMVRDENAKVLAQGKIVIIR